MEPSSSGAQSSSSTENGFLPPPPPQASGTITLSDAVVRSLECSLCLNIICEPITISCGHSFCRVCLVKSLRRHKKRCPTCREVCHITAENAAETIMIKTLAIAIDPEGYAARLAETLSEKETWTTLYPIFYYNNSMFPGGRLNLHLFEPRYKLMMQRIINTTRAFAYVPNFTTYNAQIGDIALIAELKDAEFLADGRCLLDAVLTKRKQIVDHYIESGTQGLHYCRLGPYDDEPIPSSMTDTAARLKQEGVVFASIVMEASASSRRNIEGQYGVMPSEIEAFSLWLTAISPISEKDRFALLLSKDTVVRLQTCLEKLGPVVRRAAERSGASGTVSGVLSTALRGLTTFLHATGGVGDDDDDDEEDGEDEDHAGEDAQHRDDDGHAGEDDTVFVDHDEDQAMDHSAAGNEEQDDDGSVEVEEREDRDHDGYDDEGGGANDDDNEDDELADHLDVDEICDDYYEDNEDVDDDDNFGDDSDRDFDIE